MVRPASVVGPDGPAVCRSRRIRRVKIAVEQKVTGGNVGAGGGIYVLEFVGTPGVEYFVEATTNLLPPTVWEALPGSTNQITDSEGEWDHVLTNQARRQFFRSSVVTP